MVAMLKKFVAKLGNGNKATKKVTKISDPEKNTEQEISVNISNHDLKNSSNMESKKDEKNSFDMESKKAVLASSQIERQFVDPYAMAILNEPEEVTSNSYQSQSEAVSLKTYFKENIFL